MLDRLPRPAIIAHRGASAFAPENTLAAFELAIQQGADAVELDAQLSRDGEVVVIHDTTVDRTTNGSGRVNQLALSELRTLDAGAAFHQDFAGQKIPTLAEVFATFAGRILFNVELKNYAAPADRLPLAAAELVESHRLTGQVLFSSFNPLALLRARRSLPAVPLALLAEPGPRGAWARGWPGDWLKTPALHPHFLDVNTRLVARAHRAGRRVHAYTVNREDEQHRLFQLGIDGIFTDDPPQARRTLDALLPSG